MKLIVGLGNPGKQYEKTRHNTGFLILDAFAKKHGVTFQKEQANGLLAECMMDGEKVYLLKPQSFMNLSGTVIEPILKYYKIPVSDLLVISDDLDQPVGNVRLRPHGSSGGHNGLKNIETMLHTQDYKRMRVGISKNPEIDKIDYVTGKFSKEDLEILEKNMPKYSKILEDFIKEPFEELMSRYNSNRE